MWLEVQAERVYLALADVLPALVLKCEHCCEHNRLKHEPELENGVLFTVTHDLLHVFCRMIDRFLSSKSSFSVIL